MCVLTRIKIREQRFGKLFDMIRRIQFLMIPLSVAVAMTVLFWWPLYNGAGLIGGDLYPYFFPQKAFYADSLKSGTFPLWNDLCGFGYPILGESQTGAAYPFHFVFYRLLGLSTAYNVEHLLHYLICFVATFLFSKRIGLTNSGAYLAAITFTYGWFPPRACLEWAILTGAWLPVSLYCVESFLQTGLWRYAIGLSVATGLQLLAGHYHLAFITQLVIVTYVGWRILVGKKPTPQRATDQTSHRCKISSASALTLSLMAGIGLSCVQLLPTWELKQRSSRVVTSDEYDPAYGHMPPLYITQLIAPWCWYSPLEIDEDNIVREFAELVAPWHWFGPVRDAQNPNQPYDLQQSIQQCRFVKAPAGTNKVEAHFYCGLVPVLLAFLMIATQFRRRFRGTAIRSNESILQSMTTFWLIAGILAIIYATGLLVPIGRLLPGFSFFRGPGRYGIVPTLAIALMSGQMLGDLLARISTRTVRVLLMIAVFSSTCGDLWLVSRMVKYAVMVSPPAISYRDSSEVRRRLMAEPEMPRLLAPGPNVGNLLNVSCVPWYLGIAPSEYVDPQFAMPPFGKPLTPKQPAPASDDLVAWLAESGVTHVLALDPLDEPSWHMELIWSGVDPFLNRVWGRNEPIYLYRHRPSDRDRKAPLFAGRAYVMGAKNSVRAPDWKDATPDSRRLQFASEEPGNTVVILTELAYPGWTAQQDAKMLECKQVGMFRAVTVSGTNGDIVWKYRPRSVLVGAAISLASLILLAAIAHMRYWHPQLTNRILEFVRHPLRGRLE